MVIIFNCSKCRNEVIEGDDEIGLDKFLSTGPIRARVSRSDYICKSCTRKAQAKADWVAVARTDYKGWLGAFGRWYCGINAAVLFEQAWAQDWQKKRDDKVVATALGDFRCSFGEDGVRVLSGPTPMPKCKPLRPDTPPPAPPKTRQQAIEDRFMENHVYKRANNHRHVFEKDPVTFFDICHAVRSMGGSVIVVDGEVIPLPLHDFKGQLLSYNMNGVDVNKEDLQRLADAWQVDRRLDSLYVDQINGVYEVHAALVPRAEAEVVEPADKFTDELVSSKLNIQDLCRVMEIGFDKAGPDKDISVVIEYKQAGDLATAGLKMEIVSCHQITTGDTEYNVSSIADTSELGRQIADMELAHRDRSPKGSPDAEVETIDLGFGSEFDLLMMAANRCLNEIAIDVPGLTLARFLEHPGYYNKWYAAVKADRRREWEISNAPHQEV